MDGPLFARPILYQNGKPLLNFEYESKTLRIVLQLFFSHCNIHRGNYSFLNLDFKRLQYIRLKVTVHKCAETIQGRKLYEEIQYIQ